MTPRYIRTINGTMTTFEVELPANDDVQGCTNTVGARCLGTVQEIESELTDTTHDTPQGSSAERWWF